MLTEARLRGTEHALVVGAATGYAAALLAELVTSVVALEEEDARTFAARLAELPRLSPRMAGELHFEIERTTLHGIWPGGRGPLTLTIRTSGPRGGLKACTITLDRRQVESLAAELQFGLRRVRSGRQAP